MRIKKDYVLRTVANEYIVVPIGTEAVNFNGVMSLNETGKWLWEQLTEETTMEALVQKMVLRYKVDEVNARNDILEFIDKLNKKAVLM
jgi:sensor domain CHASE-containing protein